MVRWYDGRLEIDYERGVIYFHDLKTGQTLLRICRLPLLPEEEVAVDITHMVGVIYTKTLETAHE